MKLSRSAAAVFAAMIFAGVLYAPVFCYASDATPHEEKLARRTKAEIEKHFEILHDPVRQARVEMIVERLRPFMERDLDYEVFVIDHEMTNAFAISGGAMYVSTGMLEFVRSDLELAGVIAHEMVHADRKHVIIQMARNDRMSLIALAAAIASKGHGAAMMAVSALQVAVMGAYSIDIEKEADARGIDALTHAGYDPVGVLTLQERLREEAMKRPQIDPGIYQTHPETKERIAAAEKYMLDNGLPVHRKSSLGLLRTSVRSDDGVLSLEVDGVSVLSGDVSADGRELFDRIAADIDERLQLETAPFDLRVQGEGRSKALFISGRRLARESETAPYGGVEMLRSGLHERLAEARDSHPLADYFK